MKSQSNLVSYQHDSFIYELITNKIPVSVYMRNGIKLTGHLIGHDDNTFLLHDVTSQLVYKNAISTILPSSQAATVIKAVK